jgi:LysM repeat protein
LSQADWKDQQGESRVFRLAGPLLSGLFAAAVVLLTLFVAVVLGMQEQKMVAGLSPTASDTAPAATATPTLTLSPSATSRPEASARPLPSSTPSPLPSPTPTASRAIVVVTTVDCDVPADWRPYVVQDDDTFAKIANRYGITVNRLLQGNCLDPDQVAFPGLEIYVPHRQCRRPAGWVDYTIRPGDTLSSLAPDYGLTVAELKRANCLTDDLIYAGATLWVPFHLPSPVPATRTPTRTPQPTDTPWPLISTTPTQTAVTTTPTGSATPGPTVTKITPGTPSVTPTTEPPTATPGPTDTGQPTDTPLPPTATDTQPPPTDTQPPPTSTPVPPTSTPVPPTSTPVPPTATPVPPSATP